jgi:hypothetical protein
MGESRIGSITIELTRQASESIVEFKKRFNEVLLAIDATGARAPPATEQATKIRLTLDPARYG